MKASLQESMLSLLNLTRFLAWYGLFVLLLFVVLPDAGSYLEQKYEALGATVRFAGILGFLIVVAVWHVISTRDRWQRARKPGA